MILQKKKSYFEEELDTNRIKRTLEGFKVTRSKLGQNKVIKSFSLDRWCYSIPGTEKCKYFQKVLLLISRRPPRKTAKGAQKIYLSNNQKIPRQDFIQRIQ